MTQPPARVPVPAKYEHFYVLWALQLARNILSAHIIMVTCSRHPIVPYIALDTYKYTSAQLKHANMIDLL